jgi:hypothetical protein
VLVVGACVVVGWCVVLVVRRRGVGARNL